METSRRDFLMATGALAAATTMTGAVSPAFAQAPAAGEAVTHTQAPLPYEYGALEPYIDARTVELHYTKHHAAYVKGLNAAEKALADARSAKDFALVQHWSRQYAFHSAGHYLHTLYWSTMAPAGKGGGGEPAGALADKIKADFGGVDVFKAQLSAAAAAVAGSGWGLVHYHPVEDRLLVLQVENHEKLSPWGTAPILTVDVWEHAYYLKYQNLRPDYITAWWNVVNWEQVAKDFEAAHSKPAA